jgi:hypothetical protein
MTRPGGIGMLVIALALGLALGAAGAFAFRHDVIMAAGVKSGLATGICATIEAARGDEALLTEADAERLLQRTAATFNTATDGPAIPATVEACNAALARLRDG